MRNLLKALILMLITMLALIITVCGGEDSDKGNDAPIYKFVSSGVGGLS
jgi:hypothetical protein